MRPGGRLPPFICRTHGTYYDRIGCGNSPGPDEDDFYSVELFEEELSNLIKALDLTEVYILGQSWGGMLLLDYMITKRPQGVKSIVLSSRHVVNFDPLPDFAAYSFENQSRVYIIIQGYTEFMVIGKLKGWDVTDRLGEITVPALLVSGVSDEVRPLLVKQEYDRIPHAEWHLLPGTHLVHVEQWETYNRLVEEFLNKQETL